jgi:conjugative transposon TraM protein
MEKQRYSAKFLRRRKLMMVLPLLVLPFLTMAFWALGGGESSQEIAVMKEGLNLELPDANTKDETAFDKLSFYKQAENDSTRLKEMLKNDPYYRNELEGVAGTAGYSALNSSPYGSVDPNVRRVQEKINELNQQLNHPARHEVAAAKVNVVGGDVDRLSEMMEAMNAPGEKDEEMEQISSMLDKIIDVQHPTRVRERARQQSLKNKQVVYTVNGDRQALGETIMLKDSVPVKRRNDFYSEASKPLAYISQSSVTAVIHETQTLVAGSTVKLRLTSDVYINGILIPSGTFVFGTASMENERLLIVISSINYRSNLLPVSLFVHDIDGVAGVYIPGSINRDVAKRSADQSLSGVDLVTMDPSIQAQATAAGITAAKTLLSKKVKLVKVTVKAGYRVLLKDKNQQNY